jgi:hypothetical protein
MGNLEVRKAEGSREKSEKAVIITDSLRATLSKERGQGMGYDA